MGSEMCIRDRVKALTRIAPIHREVLVLYYFDDMPTARMAEALEVAPGTVLSRLARAREALRAVMTAPHAARGSAARPSRRRETRQGLPQRAPQR